MKKLVNLFYFLLITGIAAFTVYSFKGKVVNRTPLKISDKFKDVVEEVISVKELRGEGMYFREILEKWEKFEARIKKMTARRKNKSKEELKKEAEEDWKIYKQIRDSMTKEEAKEKIEEYKKELYEKIEAFFNNEISGEEMFRYMLQMYKKPLLYAAYAYSEDELKELAEEYKKKADEAGAEFLESTNKQCMDYNCYKKVIENSINYIYYEAVWGYYTISTISKKEMKYAEEAEEHFKKAEELDRQEKELDKEEKGWHETAEQLKKDNEQIKKWYKEEENALDKW